MSKQVRQAIATPVYVIGAEGDQEADDLGYVDDTQLQTLLNLPADTVADLALKLEDSDIDELSKLNAILTDATLIDTGDARLPPASLTGEGGKLVRVNSGETALEYAAVDYLPIAQDTAAGLGVLESGRLAVELVSAVPVGLRIGDGLTTGGLSLVDFDPDAVRYIQAVEAADGESLEFGVRQAIRRFIARLKAEQLWDQMEATVILAGARTLPGCLVPLKGVAPSNIDFVPADYNRKTGLKGDGVSKHLNSNRNNNADPQNNHHLCVYATEPPTSAPVAYAYAGAGAAATGSTQININTSSPNPIDFRSRSNTADQQGGIADTGLIGMSRSSATGFTARSGGTEQFFTRTSQTSFAGNIRIFARLSAAIVVGIWTPARLAFYSIGKALDLEKLDDAVADFLSDVDDAI